ncbi:hypothetical protein TNCV_3351871 [Trichonephila clavipes]|nr:hypothetical protein TNCV_3351871 [Trichonephila clavipes]
MRAKAFVPNSVYVTLGPEMHEQMFQSGGQSYVKTSSVKFPRKLETHLLTHPLKRGENLSQPCPDRGLNLEIVVWKRDELTTQPLASIVVISLSI